MWKCLSCENNVECTSCPKNTDRIGSDCHCDDGYYEKENEIKCL
jgi:hypothetical protein